MTLEEIIIRRIPFEIFTLAFVLAAAVFFIFGALASCFVLAGGTVSAAGFFWLWKSLGKALLKEKKGALRIGIFLYTLRLVLILAVFLIIIFFFPKKILAFAAGFSTVIPVFLVEGVRALAASRTWKN